MKICESCGQSVQDSESYCPRCGGRKLKQKVVQNQNAPIRQQQVKQAVKSKKVDPVETDDDIFETEPDQEQDQDFIPEPPRKAAGRKPQAGRAGQAGQKSRAAQPAKERPVKPNPKQVQKNQPQRQQVSLTGEPVVTWKEFLKLYLFTFIPIYGIIKMFQTKSDASVKPELREFAKFMLALFVVAFLFSLLALLPVLVMAITGAMIFI